MDWTEEPECPYCEHEMRDAWELGLVDGDKRVVVCGNCDRQYRVTTRVYVEYSTRPWTALDRAREGLARARIAERAMRRASNGCLDWNGMPKFNDRTCRLEALVERLSAEAGAGKDGGEA